MAISDRITAITNHLTDDWNSIDRLGLHTNILPKEYTQVDYIESSGTQYIDTGVNADNKLDTILDMAFTSPTSSNQNVGAILIDGSTTVRYHILCDSSQNNNFRMYAKINYVGVGTLDANRHTFEFDCTNGKVYFDGTAYNKDTTNFDVGLNFWLFGRNSTSTIYYSNVKQYGCKMYYNNVLVRDFIPCFRNTDNEVGLYDLVNNVFYTNQGTGTFTYGQVQEQHIDKNIENIKEPLDLFYNEVSDKTDLSVNGVVGRTSQETTTGKNYLNPVPFDTTTGGITTTANTNTGYITMVGTSDRNYPWILKADTNIPSGTTVVVSSDSQYTMYARLYYDSTNYETINTSTTESITLSHDIIKIAVLANMPTGTVVNETCYVQVEEGSTATSFEKFTFGASPNPDYIQPINNLTGNKTYKITTQNDEETFTIPLGDIELAELGTYKDRIYSNNGKFYLEKQIGKVILDGSENWTGYTTEPSGLGRMILQINNIANVSGSILKCNKLQSVIYSNSWNLTYDCVSVTPTDIRIIMYLKNVSNGQTFKEMVNTILPIIYYPLATPTTTEINEENYPQLYAVLKQIQDYLTAYKINKEFILGYSSPEIEY